MFIDSDKYTSQSYYNILTFYYKQQYKYIYCTIFIMARHQVNYFDNKTVLLCT